MKNSMKDSGTPKTGNIDWSELKRRMAAASAAIEQAWEPSPEDAKRILKVRTQALAREPVATTDDTRERLELVEFNLAYERYAFELKHVREVCSLQNLTSLPCTPAFVLGIINLRGEILSVIDMKKFFDLPDKGLTDLNKVIVLESADMAFGILADRIIGTSRIPLSCLQSRPATLTGIRGAYLKGVTPERTVIVDAEKLLSSKNLIVQEQVTG
ncbi:MAG: chemotaxis protein CheW [Gammaproteobacteria bacterium]